MKRLFYLGIIVLIILAGAKFLIRADIPISETSKTPVMEAVEDIDYPKSPKTVEIEGVEYLQTQAPIGKYGGTLVASTIGEGPKTFNPFNVNDATSSTFTGIMFEGLVTSNPVTGEIIPRLAKSYEILNNGTEYIIHLRHGIEWSDMQPITADDVVFSWNDIILAGFGNTSTRDSIIIDGRLPKVEKIDDFTVKFTLPKAFAPFTNILSAPIGPKHILEPQVKKGKKSFDAFWGTSTPTKNFVVSGAFKLKEYKAAQRVVLERNQNYYLINTNETRLPYLDKLVYLIVGDLNNEILKFEAKEIDVIGLRGSNVARYKKMEKNSDFKVYNLGPDTGTMFLALNLNTRNNPQGKPYVNPVKQKWFASKDFRNAIDWAVDRDSMVKNVANGLAQPLFTSESLNSIYLNKNIEGHQRNIETAKYFLTLDGFYNDEKGNLIDKNGNPVEFDLYTNAGNTEREALGVMVKQDLEDIGIKINFKPVEFNSLVNKMTNTLDFDMVLMGLTGSPLEPHNGKIVWNSNGSLHIFNQRLEPSTLDDRFSWEKDLDYLFEMGALTTNFNDRKQYYDKYQQIIYDEKPIIYLYSPTRVNAIRRKFKNIFPTKLAGLLYNLEEIYIGK